MSPPPIAFTIPVMLNLLNMCSHSKPNYNQPLHYPQPTPFYSLCPPHHNSYRPHPLMSLHFPSMQIPHPHPLPCANPLSLLLQAPPPPFKAQNPQFLLLLLNPPNPSSFPHRAFHLLHPHPPPPLLHPHLLLNPTLDHKDYENQAQNTSILTLLTLPLFTPFHLSLNPQLTPKHPKTLNGEVLWIRSLTL